jgi:hypothetical protein
VRIDGERIEDKSRMIKVGANHLIQVGKRRFQRVFIKQAESVEGNHGEAKRGTIPDAIRSNEKNYEHFLQTSKEKKEEPPNKPKIEM